MKAPLEPPEIYSWNSWIIAHRQTIVQDQTNLFHILEIKDSGGDKKEYNNTFKPLIQKYVFCEKEWGGGWDKD